MEKLRETDLYPPLKTWLEDNGYSVQAEVKGCDVVARKNGELVIIEMKKAVNLDLLLQVTRRQRARASVYAAVPSPKSRDRRWRSLARLLQRLEAGLLLIHIDSALPRVEVAFHPMERPRPARDSGATRALLREMNGRSVSMNVGGSVRKRVMTAYRERALTVAVSLEKTGPASPREMRRVGAPDNTGGVLQGNHYNWFEKLGPALYALTPAGRQALEEPEYAELIAALRLRRDAFTPPERPTTKKKTVKKEVKKAAKKHASAQGTKKKTAPATPPSDQPPPPR